MAEQILPPAVSARAAVRNRRFARGRTLALSALAGCLVCPGASAAQVELGVSLGVNVSRAVTLASRSNDRASICDEYINPRALAVPGCTTPERGAGDGWRSPFDAARGFSGEAELGLRLSRRVRIAAVYAYDSTDFDQTVSSTDATGEDFDKIVNELSVGVESLGTASSHDLFLVAYRDWPNRTQWTPYAGAGIGASWVRMDLSWIWARSADPDLIETGAGQPNADEIRRNLAGTVSAGRRALRDAIPGYVLVAGADRALSDALSVGFKAQWKHFDSLESGAYAGDLLRSHAPNLRLDGSEPVSTRSRTDGSARFSVMFTVRYAVP